MTSFGVSKQVSEPGFMPTFKVQGQVYHLIGSLQPLPNEEPKFLQVYFMGDSLEQATHRCSYIPGLQIDIVMPLQEMLHTNNALIQCFKTSLDAMPQDSNEYRVVIRADKRPAGEHARRFNAPVANEVAVLLVGQQHEKRDIVLHLRDNSLKHIAETHRSYDALQYPLISWQGQDGYHFGIYQMDPATSHPHSSRKVSAKDFYAYHLLVRATTSNHILKCRDLFHQFVVDMYAKMRVNVCCTLDSIKSTYELSSMST